MGQWNRDGSYTHDESDIAVAEAYKNEKYGPKGTGYREPEKTFSQKWVENYDKEAKRDSASEAQRVAEENERIAKQIADRAAQKEKEALEEIQHKINTWHRSLSPLKRLVTKKPDINGMTSKEAEEVYKQMKSGKRG